MPTRRKRPGTHRGHRTVTSLELVGSPAAPAGSVPEPPSLPGSRRLLVVTVKAWDAFWNSELAQLVDPVDACTALPRLFRMYDQRERFERLTLATPMVEGSQGQPVVNPAAGQVASLDVRILALEDRFGITPMARLKLGITFGAATRSLEDLNRDLEDDEPDEDPRLVIQQRPGGNPA